MAKEGLTKVEIYAEMLTLQARMHFPFEQHFFQTQGWKSTNSVVDIGCGNLAYAKLLDETYPGKNYVGIEHDADMRAIAFRNCRQNFKLVSSIDEVENEEKFDFFLLRLVLLHVVDREVLYRFIRERSSSGAQILVFDAEDDALGFNPKPDRFVRALAELRSKSKNRKLREVIPKELEKYGFSCEICDTIVVNNMFQHVSEDMFKYMYRTAELGIGSPLPDELRKELIEWWMSTPYVQYGFFGQLYKMDK